jgi:hypothetical protein
LLFEQTSQDAVRHHNANSPVSLREQKKLLIRGLTP